MGRRGSWVFQATAAASAVAWAEGLDLVESEPPPPIRTTVDRVTLFRSHLGRGGAVYEPIEEFQLS